MLSSASHFRQLSGPFSGGGGGGSATVPNGPPGFTPPVAKQLPAHSKSAVLLLPLTDEWLTAGANYLAELAFKMAPGTFVDPSTPRVVTEDGWFAVLASTKEAAALLAKYGSQSKPKIPDPSFTKQVTKMGAGSKPKVGPQIAQDGSSATALWTNVQSQVAQTATDDPAKVQAWLDLAQAQLVKLNGVNPQVYTLAWAQAVVAKYQGGATGVWTINKARGLYEHLVELLSTAVPPKPVDVPPPASSTPPPSTTPQGEGAWSPTFMPEPQSTPEDQAPLPTFATTQTPSRFLLLAAGGVLAFMLFKRRGVS